MKNKILIYFLFVIILLLLGCGQGQTTRYQTGYRHYSIARHTGHPYLALKYIKDAAITDSTDKPTDPLLAILWKYSPDAYYLVHRMETLPQNIRLGTGRYFRITAEGPATRTTVVNGRTTVKILTGKGFRKWIESDKPFTEQIKSIPTAVHEICHGYTNRYSNYLFSKKIRDMNTLIYSAGDGRRFFTISFDSFYRNKDTNLYVLRRIRNSTRYTEVFPAKKIASMIPEENRTFRYKTYILSEQSTQSNGISGLLDEYNAYYWSNKVVYDLYEYFKNEQPQNQMLWINWVGQIFSYYFSYAEFRYWILAYLQYSKKNEPDIYQSFLKDKYLRMAFTRIDDEFTELIQKIFTRLFTELPEYLKKLGIKVMVNTKGITFIKNKKLITDHYQIQNISRGMFSYYYRPLEQTMLKPEFVQIANEFRTAPAAAFPSLEIPATLIRR